MSFISVSFLCFFPLVCLVYYSISAKYRTARNIWLLLANACFFLCLGLESLLFVTLVTIVSYFCAIGLQKINQSSSSDSHKKSRLSENGKKKLLLTAGLLIVLGFLAFYKYYDFSASIGTRLFSLFNIAITVPSLSLTAPIGISFYSLQVAGYLIDVYRGKTNCEKNPLDYALFVTYFPQIVSGPIGRADSILPQLKRDHPFNENAARTGLLWMAWGFFLKLAVADRLAILVNTVFNSPGSYKGLPVLTAVFFYAFQIYCDFCGYSMIAYGSSQVLGITLINNFRMPYFSRSVKEFWSRWHISLSTWLKDYLYFPLGGSRCSKAKRDRNLFIVFAVSGLWHGASLSFVVWGMIHGIYQIVEKHTVSLRAKINSRMHLDRHPVFHSYLQMFITFCLVALAWIPFRANSVKSAVTIFTNMFYPAFWPVKDGSYYGLGLDVPGFVLCIIGITLVLVVDYFREKKVGLLQFVYRRKAVVRYGIYIGAVLAILFFGVYGPGYSSQEFIYGQF